VGPKQLRTFCISCGLLLVSQQEVVSLVSVVFSSFVLELYNDVFQKGALKHLAEYVYDLPLAMFL